MIRTFGKSEYQDENDASVNLMARFLEWRPELETNGEEVIILIAVKTPGNRGVQDIDLVVLARLDNPLELELSVDNVNRKVRIWNFCLALEIKRHASKDIRFIDNKVDVLYKTRWSGASIQAENEAKTLKKSIKNEVGSAAFCYGLLWMTRLNAEQLRPLNSPNNVLPATLSIEQMCRKFLSVNHPNFQNGEVVDIRSVAKLDFRSVAARLTAEPAVGVLDRKKVDKIIKQNISFKNVEQLGNTQQIVFGRAGSGKTMVLLKVALHLFNENKRVALLTYNRTLVADLQRLLYHMGVKADSWWRNVNVMTLHAYFIALSRAIVPELVPEKITATWLEHDYANGLKEAHKYLRLGTILYRGLGLGPTYSTGRAV